MIDLIDIYTRILYITEDTHLMLTPYQIPWEEEGEEHVERAAVVIQAYGRRLLAKER